jgi:hypothetical protein
MATGIDKLNKAARAAGFAMVPFDDDAASTRKPASQAQTAVAKPDTWRSASRALQPATPRIVVRGSLLRHWLAGWAGRATAS